MLIDSSPLWLGATNAYVVARDRGEPAILIDAPPDLAGIKQLLAKHELVPVAVVMTHGHIDHVAGAASVIDSFQIRAYLHPDDEYLAAAPEDQIRMLFGAAPPGVADEFAPPEHFEQLADDQILELGGVTLKTSHTPGHTMGHCCFLIEDEGVLFSGDHLFAGGVGRTDLGGDLPTLFESMRGKTLLLPDDYEVLPGHGPATTIGRERTTNPFLQGLR